MKMKKLRILRVFFHGSSVAAIYLMPVKVIFPFLLLPVSPWCSPPEEIQSPPFFSTCQIALAANVQLRTSDHALSPSEVFSHAKESAGSVRTSSISSPPFSLLEPLPCLPGVSLHLSKCSLQPCALASLHCLTPHPSSQEATP